MASGTVKSLDMKDLSAIEESARIIAEANATIERETRKRDRHIAAARKDGYPWPRIAEAARLTRAGAELAARRGNNGELPRPRQQG